jgi:hypothetical protein
LQRCINSTSIPNLFLFLLVYNNNNNNNQAF